MAEQDDELNKVKALAERLGLGKEGVDAIAANPSASDFLASLDEADANLLVNRLSFVPTPLKTELFTLVTGADRYFFELQKEHFPLPTEFHKKIVDASPDKASLREAEEEELAPQQAVALVLVMKKNGFHTLPPEATESKQAFQAFLKNELTDMALGKFTSFLAERGVELPPYRLQTYRELYSATSFEGMVVNGQVDESLTKLSDEMIAELKQELERNKVFEEFWEKPFPELEKLAEQRHMRNVLGLSNELISGIQEKGYSLRDKDGNIHPKLKEALVAINDLSPEAAKDIINSMNSKSSSKEEIAAALETQFKEKAGIDVDAIHAEASQNAGRGVEEPAERPQSQEQGGAAASGEGEPAKKGTQTQSNNQDKEQEEKQGWKKFVNTKTVVGAAIVATIALIALLAGKSGKKEQQAGGRGM